MLNGKYSNSKPYEPICSAEESSIEDVNDVNEVGESISAPSPRENAEYQVLPRKFFAYKDLPPPLVNKSWLKSFYERSGPKKRKRKVVKDAVNELPESHEDCDRESCVEDYVPLSNLKSRLSSSDVQSTEDQDKGNHNPLVNNDPLGNNDPLVNNAVNEVVQLGDRDVENVPCNKVQNHRELQDVGKKTGEKTADEGCKPAEPVVIHRKRGRPKKQTELTNASIIDDPNNISDEILNEEDDDDNASWWSKNDDVIDNNEPSPRNELDKDVEQCAVENYETDYFDDTVDEADLKAKRKKPSNVKLKKKKGANGKNGGIRIGNSKLVYPCKECGKSFSAPSTLKYHMRIHNGTLIKCSECDRGFTTNYLLKCHMRIHNGDLFMCHECGKGFTTAELLKVHGRCHTGVRPYRCQICEKTFPSASNLAQHKETHEPEKKYLCSLCGSAFTQKRCLDGHMLSHGEKNNICSVCGKLWARKSDLMEHMRVHTGSKPYACASCPLKFTQASSLKRHQIVHKGANPVQCLTCGKMLKCNEYYKRHMKKHEKEKEIHIALVIQ